MHWRKSHNTTNLTVSERTQTRLKLSHSIYGTKRQKDRLKVKWSNTELENTDLPKYLGVTLDRTLSYKTAYTQYEAEGGHTQQSSAEIGKLEVGHKCKHDQNHCDCFMLFRR